MKPCVRPRIWLSIVFHLIHTYPVIDLYYAIRWKPITFYYPLNTFNPMVSNKKV